MADKPVYFPKAKQDIQWAHRLALGGQRFLNVEVLIVPVLHGRCTCTYCGKVL